MQGSQTMFYTSGHLHRGRSDLHTYRLAVTERIESSAISYIIPGLKKSHGRRERDLNLALTAQIPDLRNASLSSSHGEPTPIQPVVRPVTCSCVASTAWPRTCGYTATSFPSLFDILSSLLLLLISNPCLVFVLIVSTFSPDLHLHETLVRLNHRCHRVTIYS